MQLSSVFTAKAVGMNYTEAASNRLEYLGRGLFPAKKKGGIDLKWIKGHKGLPVSLMPSAFDAKSTFRDRIGLELAETQMAFYRESMLIKEADEQEILRVQDANDPYAQAVIDHIYDDARTLIDGANVVPERMIMQLLSPISGSMGIEIAANGVNHTYNYDPKGKWRDDHYIQIASAADKWDQAATCDPMQDLEDALDAQESASGNRPEIALMSKKTFNYIKNSEKVRKGILAMAGVALVNMTSKRVKEYVKEELNLTIIVYTKKYRDETGNDHNFYPDNIVMLLPAGAVGNTWYGTTPEERTLIQRPDADVYTVSDGPTISVTITDDPVHTKTTCSEILLPSFEGMDSCYALEVA